MRIWHDKAFAGCFGHRPIEGELDPVWTDDHLQELDFHWLCDALEAVCIQATLLFLVNIIRIYPKEVSTLAQHNTLKRRGSISCHRRSIITHGRTGKR
jgi:hypothetical protein